MANVSASEDTGTILMIAAILPGLNADPAVMRSSMCNVLGRVRTAADAVGVGESAGSGEDRSRTAPPDIRSKNKVLRPRAIFNLEQAQAALEPGTGKITGTACVQRQGNLILASNYPIYLYPVTPYMEEAIGLLRKDHAGKAAVELSRIAMATRMNGQANEKGEFQFSKMKPGKYYLMTTLSNTFMDQRQVKAGSYSGGIGGMSGDIYRMENYRTDYEDLLEEIVEIKRDGETVKVALTPRVSLKTGGLAGLFGCRRLP